jgi:hypothetical protein
MMLVVVPATIRHTVITTGSNTRVRRVIIVWIAPTIAAAAGTGSSASCGIAACPPRPVTVTRSVSEDAMVGPGRHVTSPDGSVEVMCTANARSGVPAGPPGSSSPSSIMCRAPK